MKLTTPDGFTLEVIYQKTENAKGVIIFAHGMTVRHEDEGIFVKASGELSHKGFSTILFDFRAHGKSSGDSLTDFTITNELIDLQTIMDFVHQEGYSLIGLAGASFGGGIASLYAGLHPERIQKLCLANPVLDFDQCFLHPPTPWAKQHFANVFERLEKEGSIKIGSRQYTVGRELFEQMRTYKPYETLESFQNPLLVVHGDLDSKVDHQKTFEHFQKLSNIQKRFETIKNSEHGFHEEPFETDVADMITKFFE